MSTMNRRQLFQLFQAKSAKPSASRLHAAVGQSEPLLAPAQPVDRLLGRIFYGTRLGTREQAHAQGFNAILDEQLDPDSIDDTEVDDFIAQLPYYNQSLDELRELENFWFAYLDIMNSSVHRAVYSRKQLYEKMVEFWSDHFNIYMFGEAWPQMPVLKILDDRDVIRPHAMGYFRDLLHGSAKSAAMLFYLDNVSNRVYEEGDTPNENYARELLELHTIGVDAGYTQADVQDVARILSGWATVDEFDQAGAFKFHTNAHDYGSKTVMGQFYPAGRGEEEVLDLLDQLVDHPETPRFLARKLIRRFAVDNGARFAGYDEYVEHVASAYGSDGDITAMLDALFRHPRFSDERLPAKLKRPYDYFVSACRGLAVDIRGGDPTRYGEHLFYMGQPFMEWEPPNGYPDVASPWINNLLPRWNFATYLTQAWLDIEPDWDALEAYTDGSIRKRFEQLYLHLTGRELETTLGSGLVAFVNGAGSEDEYQARLEEVAALMISSPAFHWV